MTHLTAAFVDFWAMEGIALVMFISFALVERAVSSRAGKGKPPDELVTDLFYWTSAPVLRQLENLLVASVLAFLTLSLGASLPGGVDGGLAGGFGPLSRLPLPVSVAVALVISDLSSYWLHRLMHVVPFLWRIHAIHHSSPTLRWSSAGRTHPINEVVNFLAGMLPCLALGLPLQSVVTLVPLMTTWSVMVHSDLGWTFGRLGGWLVSPLGHHWHHTHSSEGGNRNFANILSVWDRAFGTYFMPRDRVPERFGLDDEPLPENYLKQLVYPFQSANPAREAERERRSAWPKIELPSVRDTHMQ
jgi:sterol desaturase/sphingolipid hydroxylase (fatty acid hydroxylase superfamily)